MGRPVLTMTLNGNECAFACSPLASLLDVLREDFGQTGTKEGCGVGVCGACSVIIDGELMTACLYPARRAAGRWVETIEGIAVDDELTALQTAFITHGGFQCGICTPGQVIAATALLREIAEPTIDDVKEWMTGNLCRCTGYHKIVESIMVASRVVALGTDDA